MIAGPYRTGTGSAGERARNLAVLNRVAYNVFRRGHVPVIGVNMALPIIEVAGGETYEDVMMPVSLAAAERCDGILRVGGASEGADREVEVVRSQGGRVFESIDEVPDVGVSSSARIGGQRDD